MKRYKFEKYIAGIVIILAMNTIATGYVPVEEWNKTFGGTKDDYANTGQQTSDGGYILAGKTLSYGAGGTDAWIVKTDNNGKKQWSKTFGGIYNDSINSVQQTKDGGYILGGFQTTNSGSDGLLIKTYANGSLAWKKLVNIGYSNINDYVISVHQTNDNGYIFLLKSIINYGNNITYSVIKIDKYGNKELKYSERLYYRCPRYYLEQTPDGYIAVGNCYHRDSFFRKFDPNGNLINKNGIQEIGYARHAQQTTDGGYIVAGYDYTDGGYIWILRLDNNLNKLWSKTLGEGGANWVQQTSDGGYILATEGIGGAYIIKTDLNGNEQWRKFGKGYYDYVQQTYDKGYATIGSTSYGTGGYDAWLVKFTGDVSLGNALDNTVLIWDTYGNAKWFGQTSTYYYGGDAAKSGKISHNQYTTLRTYAPAGKLTFYWKVSSEANHDYLEFYIDGVLKSRISGSISWQPKTYYLGPGKHTLWWRYVKDGGISAGTDTGYVDYVSFKPVVTLYENRDYGGASQTFYGNTPWVGYNLNDIASSLKMAEGYKVTLYENRDYLGKSQTFYGNTPYVGYNMNDVTSSFKVSKI